MIVEILLLPTELTYWEDPFKIVASYMIRAKWESIWLGAIKNSNSNSKDQVKKKGSIYLSVNVYYPAYAGEKWCYIIIPGEGGFYSRKYSNS